MKDKYISNWQKNQEILDFLKKIEENYGKTPPYNIELEQAVLGAIMLEPHAIIEVIDFLKVETFYDDSHKKIYQAILDLATQNKPIDILTVVDKLRTNNHLESVGGPFAITKLTSQISGTYHLEFHARVIAQKYIQRELIKISFELQIRAYDPGDDINDLLEYAEKSIFDIASGNLIKEAVQLNLLLKDSIKAMEIASQRIDGLAGLPCGFTDIDRFTTGFNAPDLIIIAARPSMGKTAFVLNIARNIALQNKPVAFFSLEMSAKQLTDRLIVTETSISSERLKTGKLYHEEWLSLDTKIASIFNAPLYIDDTPGISIFELRAKARRLKSKYDIQLLIVDYLQLMAGDKNSQIREQEVSNISRGLKAIAKELNIPVIALSQLNRSVENRAGDKRPQLSDLRESGAIEQDADIVMFINRPERYGIEEDEEGNSTKGLAEIIIAKHRNGAVGDVKLKFIDYLAKFTDFDDNLILNNSEIEPF